VLLFQKLESDVNCEKLIVVAKREGRKYVIILGKEWTGYRMWHVDREIDHTPGFKTFQ
jgi:hypothetical protein